VIFVATSTDFFRICTNTPSRKTNIRTHVPLVPVHPVRLPLSNEVTVIRRRGSSGRDVLPWKSSGGAEREGCRSSRGGRSVVATAWKMRAAAATGC
jgi:hypothetical protein